MSHGGVREDYTGLDYHLPYCLYNFLMAHQTFRVPDLFFFSNSFIAWPVVLQHVDSTRKILLVSMVRVTQQDHLLVLLFFQSGG